MNEAAAATTMGTIPMGDVEGAPDVFLVKFFFTNERHLPKGIPQRDRPPDEEIDRFHAIQAILQDRADQSRVGRKRPGRVDTGEHVIDNLGDVQVATIRTGFANNGYLLVDVHCFYHRQKKKNVVCLNFKRIDNTASLPELPSWVTKAMRELARTTWRYCHVWNNPPQEEGRDALATINLTGRQWNGRDKCYFPPKHALVIRDRTLQAISVAAEVPEDQE